MQVLAILLGGSFLIMAGFIDDQFGLPPRVPSAGAADRRPCCWWPRHPDRGDFGGIFDTALSIILTVIWIVAITNAVNLLDGVDGLAGGVSFITAMSLLAVSAQDQAKAAATLLLAALGGSRARLSAAQLPAVAHHHGRQWRLLLRLRARRLEHPGQPEDHHALRPLPHASSSCSFLLPLTRHVPGGPPPSVPAQEPALDARARTISTTGSSPAVCRRPGPPSSSGESRWSPTWSRWSSRACRIAVIVTTAVGIIVLLAFIVWRRRRAFRRAAARAARSATAGPTRRRTGRLDLDVTAKVATGLTTIPRRWRLRSRSGLLFGPLLLAVLTLVARLSAGLRLRHSCRHGGQPIDRRYRGREHRPRVPPAHAKRQRGTLRDQGRRHNNPSPRGQPQCRLRLGVGRSRPRGVAHRAGGGAGLQIGQPRCRGSRGDHDLHLPGGGQG